MFKCNEERIRIKGDTGEAAVIFLNNQLASLETPIKEGDSLNILYAKTGKDATAYLKDYIGGADRWTIQLDGEAIRLPVALVNGDVEEDSYQVQEGDVIKVIEVENTYILHPYDAVIIKDKSNDLENATRAKRNEPEVIVKVNDEWVHLPFKETSYMFVNIFDFINFDISQPKGTIQLMLNGEKAAVTDSIKNGDEIEIYWKK